jgi:HK97 family phage major capsid protein
VWIELLKAAGDLAPGFHDIADENMARGYIASGLAKDAGDGPDKIILQRSLATLRTELSGVVREAAAGIREAALAVSPGRIDAGDQQADKTKGLTDFLRCIFTAETSRDRDAQGVAYNRLVTDYGAKRAMGEGAGATGGYSTTVQIETQILKVAAETAIVRPRAQIVPLGAREVYWPALDQYRVPAPGQSASFGGVQVYRKGENVSRVESDPSLTQVKLVAQDITALAAIGRDYMADSATPVDSLITDLMGGAIGWREDWEAFNGTGSGMMQGVYTAACTIQVTRAGGAGTPTFTYADATNMLKYIMPSSRARLCWVTHPYMLQVIQNMVDGNGRLIFVPNINPGMSTASVAPPGTLLGLPIFVSEKAPAPGNTGDVSLNDFGSYLLGTRSGLEIGLSEHFAFDKDEIYFRAKLRNDGQPWLKRAMYLADGSAANKVSAFVVLV